MGFFKDNKDLHFTHNMGMGFIRFAVFLFAVILVLAAFQYFDTPEPLKSLGYQPTTLVDLYTVKHESHGKNDTTYYTYHATFSSEDNAICKMKLSIKDYKMLNANYAIGSTDYRPLYLTPSGKTYVSIHNNKEVAEASKEYYYSNPTIEQSIRKWSMRILLALAVLITLAGYREIKLAKKYNPDYVMNDGQVNDVYKDFVQMKKNESKQVVDDFDEIIKNSCQYSSKIASEREKIMKDSGEETQAVSWREREANARQNRERVAEFDRVMQDKEDDFQNRLKNIPDSEFEGKTSDPNKVTDAPTKPNLSKNQAPANKNDLLKEFDKIIYEKNNRYKKR